MTKFALIFVLVCSTRAAAQSITQTASAELTPTEASSAISKGTWDLGVIASGGGGLGLDANTQFASLGGRVGLVLTRDHGSGWRRGNFEWAVEMLPVYTVYTPRRAVYGGSFVPAVWRWNFTNVRRIAPYVSIEGGILFSNRNLPPGDTSWVNFTPQVAMGAHVFVKSRAALVLEGAYVHHSNAGLGTENPGYNAALVFTVGYSWFKRKE